MADRFRRVSLAIGLSFALAAGASIAKAADGPPSLADSMAACGQIANIQKRVACYDALNRSANPSTGQGRVEARRRNFGITVPHLANPFASPGEAKQARAAAHREEAVDQIQARLDHTSRTPLGNLILTTTEGAVWMLDDNSASVDPRQGSEILIRRGALGGLFCDLDHWRAIRCKRLE